MELEFLEKMINGGHFFRIRKNAICIISLSRGSYDLGTQTVRPDVSFSYCIKKLGAVGLLGICDLFSYLPD